MPKGTISSIKYTLIDNDYKIITMKWFFISRIYETPAKSSVGIYSYLKSTKINVFALSSVYNSMLPLFLSSSFLKK